jgi:hypothetical protein|tara:strand:- start:484 stop:1098 length:615 start_codon:yes stop_codon:yes gene_type:complete
MSEYNLKTGDLLLFDCENYSGSGFISYFIKKFTQSNISHVAMVLKDPDFIDPSLKGYYLWESGYEGTLDPQDNKKKFGVQITPFHEKYNSYKKEGSIYIRRVDCSESLFSCENLKKVHDVVHNKRYDVNIIDWIEGMELKDNDPQKTDRFWCSALIGYIYTQCGLLVPGTDWSILRPSDFTLKYNGSIKFINHAFLNNSEEQIL